MKVLVVDDSPFIFKAVKKVLEPLGYDFCGHATNGCQALEFFEKHHPDIITMDITMPVMDGIEASKLILNKKPDANIIMMSAMGDEQLINEAKKIGVKYFVNKPFTSQELVYAIERAK